MNSSKLQGTEYQTEMVKTVKLGARNILVPMGAIIAILGQEFPGARETSIWVNVSSDGRLAFKTTEAGNRQVPFKAQPADDGKTLGFDCSGAYLGDILEASREHFRIDASSEDLYLGIENGKLVTSQLPVLAESKKEAVPA